MALKSIFEVMTLFLVADNWPVVRVEDTTTLTMQYQGEHGQWTCVAQALEERRTILFYSIFPKNIPLDAYDLVLEYIARANYGMLDGAFEFDLNDGELRFRTNITVPDIDLSLECVRQVVYDNVTAMDTYLSGLYAMLDGDTSPLEAIVKVEDDIERVED